MINNEEIIIISFEYDKALKYVFYITKSYDRPEFDYLMLEMCAWQHDSIPFSLPRHLLSIDLYGKQTVLPEIVFDDIVNTYQIIYFL